MAELKGLRPAAIVREETWAQVWPDAAGLASAHDVEVNGGVEPRRKHEPDSELMALMSLQGNLRIVAARDQALNLLGYLTWTLLGDPESKGLPIAIQGAWYAAPGSHVGGLMFDFSVELLKGLGIQCIFPHHRMQGRGADLGPFFKLRGATEYKREYILWIGEKDA